MVKFFSILVVCYSSLSVANNEFSKFFSSFEALGANFSQQTINESGQNISHTNGYFIFKRPAQFVWHTQQPIEQTLLLNNNELWLIDHELEQASMRNLDALKNTPLYWLLNRPENLKTLPVFKQEDQGVHWYDTQQSNALSFGFQENKLATIQLKNQLGQTIRVLFNNLSTNPVISPTAFELNLGKDFDVIRSF